MISGHRGALGRDGLEGAAEVQRTGGSGLLGREASSGHGCSRQGQLWKECDGNGMKMRGKGGGGVPFYKTVWVTERSPRS